jgi:hypothetical protein
MNRLNLRLVTTTTTIFAALVYAVCIAVHCTLLAPRCYVAAVGGEN